MVYTYKKIKDSDGIEYEEVSYKEYLDSPNKHRIVQSLQERYFVEVDKEETNSAPNSQETKQKATVGAVIPENEVAFVRANDKPLDTIHKESVKKDFFTEWDEAINATNPNNKNYEPTIYKENNDTVELYSKKREQKGCKKILIQDLGDGQIGKFECGYTDRTGKIYLCPKCKESVTEEK